MGRSASKRAWLLELEEIHQTIQEEKCWSQMVISNLQRWEAKATTDATWASWRTSWRKFFCKNSSHDGEWRYMYMLSTFRAWYLEVSFATSQSEQNEDILKIGRDHMCIFVLQSKDELNNNVTNSVSLYKSVCIGSSKEHTWGIRKKLLTKMGYNGGGLTSRFF